MKQFAFLIVAFFAGYASALPDFSHLVPGTTEEPPDSEFKYGPFFQLYTGKPPSATPPPYPAPTYPPQPAPTHAPQPAPTYAPQPAPTHPPNPSPLPSPTHPPVFPQPDATPEVTWDTRTAFYQFQWGSVTDGCRFKAPSTILKCLDGGILLMQEQANADCESLALDVVKCAQIDQGTDAIVDFQCVGNTVMHLTANARTLPSEATECNAFNGADFGGTAATAASLGRFCRDSDTGEVTLKNTYSCGEGEDNFLDGNQFCSSRSQCTGMDCRAFIEPVEITSLDESPDCSTPEIHRDLTDFNFNPSSLVSFNVISWTFSDMAFSCDWIVPDIEISCRNGGFPRLVKDVPFCHTPVGSQTIVCTNPDPTSADGRIIIELEFWCFGNTAEQLVLDARTQDIDTTEFMCDPEGLMVHGLEIARGCGQFDSDAFTLVNSPSFCSDPEQFHQEICFSGFSCPEDGGECTGNDISIESVGVDTSDLVVGSCIYAEQLS